MATLWDAEVAHDGGVEPRNKSRKNKKLFKSLFTAAEVDTPAGYGPAPPHRYQDPGYRAPEVQGPYNFYATAPPAQPTVHYAPTPAGAPPYPPPPPQAHAPVSASRPLRSDAPHQTSRESLDHIAQLVIQKSQLEQDIKSREHQYEMLLKESQNLTMQMRVERDAALLELKKDSSHRKDPCSSPVRESRTRRHSCRRHKHRSCRAKDGYEDEPRCVQCEERREHRHKGHEPDGHHHPHERSLPDSRHPVPPGYSQQNNPHQPHLPHEDRHFQEGFSQLELLIKQFVLQQLKVQPDSLPGPSVSLDPALALYVDRHGLRHATVFGIRDIRCIVLRGYLMHAMLERVFRCFLFGLTQTVQQSLLDAYKDMIRAYPGDPSRASRWAAGAAAGFVASEGTEGGAYDPAGATRRLAESMYGQLKPLIAQVYEDPIYPTDAHGRRDDVDFGHRVSRDKVFAGLEGIIRCAMGIARDCRLDSASFAIELPVHLAQFDDYSMWASEGQHGPVAVAYAPIVLKKAATMEHDQDFKEDRKRDRQGDDRGYLLCRGRVWRTSILSDVQNLSSDYNRDYR